MRISLQVAGIIILMVIALPVLDIPRHPQDDYSMKAWITLIDRAARDHQDDIMGLVETMEEFYENLAYHPFEISLVYANGSNQTLALKTAPQRDQDVMIFSAGAQHSSVSFDFRGPSLVESVASIILILLIIVAMFTSAIIVSTGVTRIVLNPLEKLLNVVKEIAGSIFTSVDNLARTVAKSADHDENDSEREEGNEAKMLERVLRKLTALSELTAKKSPFDNFDDLSSEDRALLMDYNINTVTEAVVDTAKLGAQKLIGAAKDREHMNMVQARVVPKIAEAGIAWEAFLSWDFDVTQLNNLQREQLAICLIQLYQPPAPSEQADGDGRSTPSLQDASADSVSVPYHNFMHAVDVAFTLTRVLKLIHSEYFISAHDRLALVVAALAHDVGHGGYNNAFLINSNDTLALIYNDKSPL
eukprot:CAMPEP_0115748342 /NCGR_PEP_ID=MMETSP0272-20121206/93623_1 /TAXON_ID=71861 /ORGANISM="Scrippsiella trochoidea, Strain CCMP3099" /LENGTH=415 /DNA_ID=CAMNT_0003193351 /DNA_START=1 /DNA_END=1245 /DNA_ORIENTATION=+